MSQDIVADGLNQIMNAKKVGKKQVIVKRISNLFVNLLDIMAKKGHIEYTIEGDKKKQAIVTITKLNFCKAIKPRFFVKVDDIDKYLRRYLPSRRLGTLVISTNKGLKEHAQALEEKIGGALIAFFY